jgi:phosphohistidine swiveling domain-containing protein
VDNSGDSLILKLDSPDATLEQVGGKGASLARMAAAGLPVPPGFHLTTAAYRRFVDENRLAGSILSAAGEAKADDPATLERVSAQIQALITQGAIPEDIAATIRQSYGALGPDDPPVAVRSSATAEDLPEMSFAGQQDTFLNVRGGEKVLEAVKRCWASLWTARALGYRARQGVRSDDVALAVVVQQLVPADAAGIMFTANPLTGARDKVMINAAWGLGEAIVGGHVTPDTFVLDKQTRAVESEEIADKTVMTVRLEDGTREEPVPDDRRRRASLEPPQAAELARLGVEIEQLYGHPIDVEWVLCDGRLSIVQARPITALPEPPATLEWNLPNPKGTYGRASVIELLPDPLSPLFATLALPCWIEAYRELLGFLGFARIMPDPFLLTINDYAYYDYPFSVANSARMLLGLPRHLPRVVGMVRRAEARWKDEARPRYAAVIAEWDARDLGTTPAAQLLDGARAIAREAANHYVTLQSGIIPIATIEVLFISAYNRLLKRKDDPTALTFLLGYDSAPIRAEKSLYDIATWARSQPALAGYLGRAAAGEIAAALQAPTSPIIDPESWREFRRRFADHLDRFGHAVYDLDFAKASGADEPAPLLETLKFFLTGQARSPHERHSTAATAREQATEALLARRNGIRLRLIRPLLRTAQRYGPLREEGLADVGLGWPLLRRIGREIGRRLVEAGAIAERDDVFWLKQEEVKAGAGALDANEAPQDYRGQVAERRATWEREAKVTPPVVLPIKGGMRFMGFDVSRWMPALSNQPAGDIIKGQAASPGRVTGVACVIHGPGEFGQMRQGGILVAKITTPAWTPLFALASGIVTDVGGPLSHSSIVAREYQIPAVLGTGVATERIKSGQRITVDGDGGVVKIER